MKQILCISALLLFPIVLTAQDPDSLKPIPELEVVTLEEPGDSNLVTGENNGSNEENEHGDTTRIKIGDKNIKIIEEEDMTKIEIFDEKKDEDGEEDEECHLSAEKNKFKGHWAGFEMGLNNMFDNNRSVARIPSASFMEINASRSLNVNLNFMQYSIGIVNTRIGLTTGLGVEFCNYFFSNNNTIGKSNGSIISVDTLGTLNKSKLTTTYLRIPLLLEVQLFGKDRDDRLYLSAGIVGGMKLGSHTKIIVSKEEGEKKSKVNDDFFLNPFRWGLTAHIGYKGITLYCDYYMTTLFQENKGPELYPFSAGLSLTF